MKAKTVERVLIWAATEWTIFSFVHVGESIVRTKQLSRQHVILSKQQRARIQSDEFIQLILQM